MVASAVGLISLLPAAFMVWLAAVMTFGVISSTQPAVEPAVIMPVVGVGLTLPLGPLVMSVGPQRRRWLWIAVSVSLAGMGWLCALMLLPVAAGHTNR